MNVWRWQHFLDVDCLVEEGNFAPTDILFQGVEAINGILPENPTTLDYFKLYFTDVM